MPVPVVNVRPMEMGVGSGMMDMIVVVTAFGLVFRMLVVMVLARIMGMRMGQVCVLMQVSMHFSVQKEHA